MRTDKFAILESKVIMQLIINQLTLKNNLIMKKLEKFANNKVLNLNLCVGGTVYQTCGEVSENCDDEAGSFVNGEYDDLNGGDGDCGTSVRNISTRYIASNIL